MSNNLKECTRCGEETENLTSVNNDELLCEECYAEYIEEKLEALIHDISEDGELSGHIYETPTSYFVVCGDTISEISNDASCSPKGGWFPDIVKGLSAEETEFFNTMMKKYGFDECFFDGYWDEFFNDYYEDDAKDYFENASEKEAEIFKRLCEAVDSNQTPYSSMEDLAKALKRFGLEEDVLYYEWEGCWIDFYENIVDTGEARGYYSDYTDEEWIEILQHIEEYKVIV